jgi:hypothetical protein
MLLARRRSRSSLGLTEEEVARRAGTTRERVREEDVEIVSGLPRQVLVGEVPTTGGNPRACVSRRSDPSRSRESLVR